jgi:hypothetical protein
MSIITNSASTFCFDVDVEDDKKTKLNKIPALIEKALMIVNFRSVQ